MTDLAIETVELEHAFGPEPVLRKLSLEVPRGSVCGLLGCNGSGKTTLIRLLLGILRPRAGCCRVLGLDPAHEAIRIRSQVGYVPQESDFDPSMTIAETLRFFGSFYPETWNDDTAGALLERFELPLLSKVGTLSVGQKARLALVTGLSFDPKLLILDEPTAGLDAVVRREFIEMIIEFMAVRGRTVFLSSHLLNEVELLANRVAIVERGKLVVESSVAALKENLCRVTAHFERAPIRSHIDGLVSCRQLGERWQLMAWARSAEEREALLEALRVQSATELSLDESSLESIFVDLVGKQNDV